MKVFGRNGINREEVKEVGKKWAEERVGRRRDRGKGIRENP